MYLLRAERIIALSGLIPQLAMLSIFGLRLQKLVTAVEGETEWAAQLVSPFSYNRLTGNSMARSNNGMYEAVALHGRWGLTGMRQNWLMKLFLHEYSDPTLAEYSHPDMTLFSQIWEIVHLNILHSDS